MRRNTAKEGEIYLNKALFNKTKPTYFIHLASKTIYRTNPMENIIEYYDTPQWKKVYGRERTSGWYSRYLIDKNLFKKVTEKEIFLEML